MDGLLVYRLRNLIEVQIGRSSQVRLYSTIVIRDDDFTCLDGQPVSLSSSESELHYCPLVFNAICEDPRHAQDGHISPSIPFSSLYPSSDLKVAALLCTPSLMCCNNQPSHQ